MKTLWHIVTTLSLIRCCLAINRTNEVEIPIAVLLPTSTVDGKCTNKAIEMAVNDVNSVYNLIVRTVIQNETESFNTTVYKITPYYEETNKSVGDAIEALHHLYKNKIKVSTIGPPYKDQNEYITEYTTANANLHISYSEANEPMENYFIMHYRSPPSIASSFHAVAALTKAYNWSRTGMLYDYSDHRYRKNGDKLRDIITKRNNANEILVDQGIWSIPVQYSVSKELGVLQDKGVRIVLTLVSIGGARKVFCEAYNRRMYQKKVIWILFETLPDDWASNKYNALETSHGLQREIQCSEDELLTASDGYISITKQGLRKDNKKTISNMTADDFQKRLQKSVDPSVTCDENIAYAYDAIWILAMGYKEMASRRDLLLYKYHDFHYGLDISQTIRKLNFEAITGPLKYVSDNSVLSRIGQITLWVNHRGEKSKAFGTHDTSSNILKLVPNARYIVFESGIVPKDRAVYIISYDDLNEALMIIMWLLSFVGIIMAFLFIAVTIFTMRYKYNYLDTPIVDCVLLIGSILCYLSVIVYGVDTRYVSKESIPKMCVSFLTLLSIGFTLTFGSLFAKTWKMYKLFMTPEIKVESISKQHDTKHVPEWVLIFIIGVLVIGDVILLTSWSVAAPFTNQVYNVSTTTDQFANIIEIKQIVRCACQNQTQFTIGIYCFKGLLLIFGLFLAWQTRNAKPKCKNDSKEIAMAIYNVVAVSVIGVICITVLSNTTKHQAMFSIIAVCVIICTTTTLLLVFLNKVRRILREKGDLSLDKKRSMNSVKESPKTKYTLEYMRKPVNHHIDVNRHMSTNTLNTQLSIDSRSVPAIPQYESMPSIGNVVSTNPAYIQSSSYIAPPDYAEVTGEVSHSLCSGIYIGSISEEDSNIVSIDTRDKGLTYAKESSCEAAIEEDDMKV